MDYKKFGKRVKKARKDKGYTQAELAEITGYSVQHISHIETGNTKLSTEMLIELANALAISVDELLADSLLKKKGATFMINVEVKSDKERRLISNVINELKRGLEDY